MPGDRRKGIRQWSGFWIAACVGLLPPSAAQAHSRQMAAIPATDPTAGSASVGGWSYNLDSGNYNFTLPVLSLAEIQVIQQYVRDHYEAVMEQDRRIRERAAKALKKINK